MSRSCQHPFLVDRDRDRRVSSGALVTSSVLVPTSKALVTSSDALVTSSYLLLVGMPGAPSSVRSLLFVFRWHRSGDQQRARQWLVHPWDQRLQQRPGAHAEELQRDRTLRGSGRNDRIFSKTKLNKDVNKDVTFFSCKVKRKN